MNQKSLLKLIINKILTRITTNQNYDNHNKRIRYFIIVLAQSLISGNFIMISNQYFIFGNLIFDSPRNFDSITFLYISTRDLESPGDSTGYKMS